MKTNFFFLFQYLIPFLLNQMGSVLYYIMLSSTGTFFNIEYIFGTINFLFTFLYYILFVHLDLNIKVNNIIETVNLRETFPEAIAVILMISDCYGFIISF